MWNWHSHLRMIDKWDVQGASAQLKEEFIWMCFWKRKHISWRALLLSGKVCSIFVLTCMIDGPQETWNVIKKSQRSWSGRSARHEVRKRYTHTPKLCTFFCLTGNLSPCGFWVLAMGAGRVEVHTTTVRLCLGRRDEAHFSPELVFFVGAKCFFLRPVTEIKVGQGLQSASHSLTASWAHTIWLLASSMVEPMTGCNV